MELRKTSEVSPAEVLHESSESEVQYESAPMYAPQQLAYAPTYSYTPSHNLTATINLDEVRLPNIA